MRQSPVITGQFQEFVLAEIAFEQQRIAELAGLKSFAHLDDGGFETAFVSDAQLHPRPSHHPDGRLPLRRRRAQRVLPKNVTSPPPPRNDLPPLLLPRCA